MTHRTWVLVQGMAIVLFAMQGQFEGIARTAIYILAVCFGAAALVVAILLGWSEMKGERNER